MPPSQAIEKSTIDPSRRAKTALSGRDFNSELQNRGKL